MFEIRSRNKVYILLHLVYIGLVYIGHDSEKAPENWANTISSQENHLSVQSRDVRETEWELVQGCFILIYSWMPSACKRQEERRKRNIESQTERKEGKKEDRKEERKKNREENHPFHQQILA